MIEKHATLSDAPPTSKTVKHLEKLNWVLFKAISEQICPGRCQEFLSAETSFCDL
jgi:hypothetical protein